MAVTNRLGELRAAGKHELADTLAVEALRNETPTPTVEGDHVRVETATFVGEHALASPVDRTDEEALRDALARRGTYAPVDDDTGRTFTTGCLFDALVEHLLEDAEPTAAVPDAGVAAGTDTDADGRADVGEETTPPTTVDASRSPTSVIRQAVAAVQSQFR
jgi:hypothetical protein